MAHLRRGLDVVLVPVELEPVGLAHQRAGLHTQQGVVGLVVVLVGVMTVVGGEQRRMKLLSDTYEVGIGPALRANAVILEFDEEVVAPEDVLETACDGDRVVEPLLLGK